MNDHGTPTRAEDIDEDDVDLSATNRIGIDIRRKPWTVGASDLLLRIQVLQIGRVELPVGGNGGGGSKKSRLVGGQCRLFLGIIDS